VARRAGRTHSNAAGPLVVSAPLIGAAHLAGASNPTTVFASALNFRARLGHFVALRLSIPYARTAVWTAPGMAETIVAGHVLWH
jgi:uncharacterized MAPEG superfamily protein